MDDLSHYRLCKELTLRQAAYLAAGVDPATTKSHMIGNAILAQLSKAVDETIEWLHLLDGRTGHPEDEALRLRPIRLDPNDPDMPPITVNAKWVEREMRLYQDDPDAFLFRPKAIDRWFKANGRGFVPKFDFDERALDEGQVPDVARSEKPVEARERTTYLNIIGALLSLVLNPREGRTGQAAVIEELLSNYSDKAGIKKSTLEQKFAEANRSLQSD